MIPVIWTHLCFINNLLSFSLLSACFFKPFSVVVVWSASLSGYPSSIASGGLMADRETSISSVVELGDSLRAVRKEFC